MSEAIAAARPPQPDWSTITDAELRTYREAENRFRSSEEVRVFTGRPDTGAAIEWTRVALPGRDLPVRVYRPASGDGPEAGPPLVVHVHGGGFVGTAVQSDWVNSHLAARLPAVVVSVEHRLLDADTPLSAAIDDGWDTLNHVVDNAGRWGIDPARVALFGESCGGLIMAQAAIRARDHGRPPLAQVLVNPCVDVTEALFDHDSITEHADTPALDVTLLKLFRRLAVPPGADARSLSPLRADNHAGLAPALVILPTHDPIADHGRRYAEKLEAAPTPVRLVEYPGEGHGFLSTPGLVPQAADARDRITAFLRERLG